MSCAEGEEAQMDLADSVEHSEVKERSDMDKVYEVEVEKRSRLC